MPEPAPGRKAGRTPKSRRPGVERGAADAARAQDPPGAGSAGDGAARAAAEEAALVLLTRGSLDIEGRLVDASNATMYCTITHEESQAACVYKPVAGERPLWDFASGTLAGREVAAYQVSRAAGWDVVPPTIFRDGPFGPGMCQLWIDADETVDLLALARRADHQGLRQMAVFDAVVNNADRKIGHLLPTPAGHLYGCDHGVCFGEEYKLRTVLWQWRGRGLPSRAVHSLTRLRQYLRDGDLAAELSRWLTASEIAATVQRVSLLLEHRVHPYPPEDWPAVPWPPI
jgi:uncharacterized repeat protein (TIGR03843 family)